MVLTLMPATIVRADSGGGINVAYVVGYEDDISTSDCETIADLRQKDVMRLVFR